MTSCRVVGLGVETLLGKMMEVDITCVKHSDCAKVELWQSECKNYNSVDPKHDVVEDQRDP